MFTGFNKPQNQSSLFGTNNNNLQSNNNVLQQQQQIPSVFNSTPQQVSRFEKYELKDPTEHRLFISDTDTNSNDNNINSGNNNNNVNNNNNNDNYNNNANNGNITNKSNGSSIKKRTIPNHLVKRISKKNNQSIEEDKSINPVLPFKPSKKFQSNSNFENDFSHLFEDNKPPTISMFDPSNFQEDLSTDEFLTNNGSTFNKMNNNPTSFNNVFQRPKRNLLKSNNNNANNNNSNSDNIKYPWSNSQSRDNLVIGQNNKIILSNSSSIQHNQVDLSNHNDNQNERIYSSVIIYGFDDHNFSLLVDHFAKYGKIMEDLVTLDFNYYYGTFGNIIAHDKLIDPSDNLYGTNLTNGVQNKNLFNKDDKINVKKGSNNNNNNSSSSTSRNNENKKLFPLFLGPGWVKITYDNLNSAIRALADNLTEDGKGNIIGVIPYTRSDLEILLNHPISDDLNIGEGLNGLDPSLKLKTNLADNEIGRYLSNARNENQKNTIHSNDSTNLSVKDGSKLLLNKKQEHKEKKFLEKTMEFFFGEGEI